MKCCSVESCHDCGFKKTEGMVKEHWYCGQHYVK